MAVPASTEVDEGAITQPDHAAADLAEPFERHQQRQRAEPVRSLQKPVQDSREP